MKRREFIVVLGGAVADPFVALAQQTGRVPRVAWVASTTPLSEMVGATPTHPLSRAFLEALRKLGYADGKNLIIEWQSAEGKFDDLPEIVRQLVANNVDVIVSPANVVTQAAKGLTSTIPIVMAPNAIPVELGFVQSLARPGGNITGVTIEVSVEIAGKRLEIIRELLPRATRVAWLGFAEAHPSLRHIMEVTCRKLAFTLLAPEHKLQTQNDYADAFALIRRESADAIYVGSSAANFPYRHLIIDFARKSRLPALYITREFADAGGLLSYGVSFSDMQRQAAVYVDKILKGAKPADLPVEQPTRFELIVNLKTAKSLGLNVPQTLLARADEVIE
jgi:ABC-type uncharacterized transport system substrate-binding protein